ncbi:MAG: hypothetical protein ACTHNO_10790 [Ralstonia sp.]|uniref:hypothetical protein n=1 Tax=Ralstonia sp. TaxID=54061 RepID=UPI003F8084C9
MKMQAVPSKLEIEAVIEITKDATTEKRPLKKLTKYEEVMERVSKWLLAHQLTGFITAVFLAVLSFFLHDAALTNAAFATTILVQVLGILLALVAIGTSIPFFHRLLKRPFSQFFHIVENSAELDLQYVARLQQCEVNAVRYVLKCYEGERIAFEKRCSILVGSVEKIGLFPALAGLITLVINLSKFPTMQNLANALVCLILAFYILGTAAFAMMQRQDRVINLLKYCLESRK